MLFQHQPQSGGRRQRDQESQGEAQTRNTLLLSDGSFLVRWNLQCGC